MIPDKAVIRPYVKKDVFNLGLEEQGQVVFPGTFHVEYLTEIEIANGAYIYKTGLDENAPEVLQITDLEKREEKRLEIRKEVMRLERMLFNNYDINENDLTDSDKFWKKVKQLHPSNSGFWRDIKIERLSNEETFLDVKNNPHDALIFHCIMGNGFQSIARSYSEAEMAPNIKKFYIEYEDEKLVVDSAAKRYINRARALLTELDDSKDTFKMYCMIRALTTKYMNITPDTKQEKLYYILDLYLSGEVERSSLYDLAHSFIAAYKRDIKELSVYAIVNTLISTNKIIYDTMNNSYFSIDLDMKLGNSKEDVIKFLLSSENRPHLKKLVNIYNTFVNAFRAEKSEDLDKIDTLTDKKTNNEKEGFEKTNEDTSNTKAIFNIKKNKETK